MAKYLSKGVVLDAYKRLGRLTDSPGTQGQTQKTSILRYMTALDAFRCLEKRNCDLNTIEDKKEFTKLVGDVVRIDSDSYTANFYDSVKDDDDYKVGSNFFSAGVVPDSGLKPESVFPYPRRKGNSPVFEIKDCVLLIDSINYKNIAEYLQTKELRIAFVLWILRAVPFPDSAVAEQADFVIESALKLSHTREFIESLCDGSVSFGEFAHDKLFTEFPCELSEKDLIPCETCDLNFSSGLRHNLIFFGAPGTGKSYQLNKLAEDSFAEDSITRVTFYPDYTYSQFVGCFKPVTRYERDGDKPVSALNSYISYEFVPGPFLETYVKAVQNPSENYLLIVEEINRANPAAVFGDVFQLLDRDASGRSEYEVAVPREMRDYLEVFLPEYVRNRYSSDSAGFMDERERLSNEMKRLSLPPNMYIWATMNSADQGVFPIDTAFKRRWDFRYVGINEGEDAVINGTPLSKIKIPCGRRYVVWNNLRRAINDFMASDGLRINEDKLLGPFFISPAALTSERFASTFKDKVLLYLYEDAGKTKRSKLFKKELNTYSKVCEAFDEIGEGIFGEGFDGGGLVDDSIDTDTGSAEG